MPPPQGTPNPLEGPGDFEVTETVHSDTYPAIDPSKVDLSGKAVFVVGGSKGIGKEIALSFARAGASKLAVGARSNLSALAREVDSVAKESGKQAPQFLPLTLDITNRQSVEEAAKTIKAEFGRLDIMIIVAAMLGARGKIADVNPDEWWATYETNLRGPYLIYHSFIPLLLETEGGLKTICAVASVGAWLTGAGISAYQSSKTALVRLADFVAAEYEEDGIVSFTVHPGNVLTEFLGPDGPPKVMEHVFVDTPRLPADSIVHLTKDHQSWLNGRYINCYWDLPQLEAKREDIVKGNKFKTTLRY